MSPAHEYFNLPACSDVLSNKQDARLRSEVLQNCSFKFFLQVDKILGSTGAS